MATKRKPRTTRKRTGCGTSRKNTRRSARRATRKRR